MYLRAISAAALMGTAFIPSQSSAAPVAAAVTATGNVCSSLASDYEQINKALALTYAQGIGDNSAPRETNRQIESANYLSRASMVLTLMQAHHCSLPDYEPSYVRYLSPALTCATDRLRSSDSDIPSCKMDTWQATK